MCEKNINNKLKTINSKQIKATPVGVTVIIMWSTLALLTSFTEDIPPFQLTAMAFSIAAVIGIVYFIKSKNFKCLKQPVHIWAIGVEGLFGFHFFYFYST